VYQAKIANCVSASASAQHIETPISANYTYPNNQSGFCCQDLSRKAFRKNWARLIQKVYNVDPLLCPKCSGSMKIISFIDDSEIIKKILQHLDLWHVKRKPPARANDPPTQATIIFDDYSAPDADAYLIDADYPIETYL